MPKLNKWHISVAAESLVASLLARIGYDVSVQYGANQPEYDLMIAAGDQLAKVSVKGSSDGSWGLTQGYLKNAEYRNAIDVWQAAHSSKTFFALVQFHKVSLEQLPRVYLATVPEIAERLKATANGRGDTILYECKVWGPRAAGAGTTDEIPAHWKFSRARVETMLKLVKA